MLDNKHRGELYEKLLSKLKERSKQRQAVILTNKILTSENKSDAARALCGLIDLLFEASGNGGFTTFFYAETWALLFVDEGIEVIRGALKKMRATTARKTKRNRSGKR